MPNLHSTQGGAAKAPPIPPMDLNPPPAPTGAQIRQQARNIARDVRAAAQGGQNAAQNAAQAGGHIATTAPAPVVFNPGNMIPPQVVDMSYAFFLCVAICVVGFPLARAFGRLMDRKVQFKGVTAPDLTPHIRQLQDSVDAMAIELERISEGQRFTAKLLAERSTAASQQQ
jgi:hypothetical protein